MKAVKKHTDNKWIILYIERWLKTPMQFPDGSLEQKTKGVMQGGVISPLLSNLYLHYVFDIWMSKHYPLNPWCRYADDGLVHCKTEYQAQQLLLILRKRFKECGLELHPDKTKIVYCKDDNRRKKYPETEFVFLGYEFRCREVRNTKSNQVFLNFTPAVSKAAVNSMRAKIRNSNLRKRTDLSLDDIAIKFNPILQGWLNYYGEYTRSNMYPVLRHFNKTLVTWSMRKFKKLKGRKIRAGNFLIGISKRQLHLFAHWKIGMIGSFA